MIHRLLSRTFLTAATLTVGLTLLAGQSAVAQDSAAQTKPAAKQGDGPTPEKLFERAIDAMGGKKAFEDMKSMHVDAELSVPQMPTPMKISLSRADGDKWLLSQMMPQGMGEIKAGSNGEVTWMHHPMAGYQLMEGQMKEQMVEQTRLVRHDLISEIKDEAAELTTTGSSSFGDEEAWEVKLVDKDGQDNYLYFSKDNGRILGVKATNQGQMGPVDVTITFSEWKEFGPFTLYTKMEMDQGGQSMAVSFNTIEVDKVEDSKFELPAEVKEMVANAATAPSSQPGG